MAQDLQGKIALVTGATSGIGMETAAALAGARECTGRSAAEPSCCTRARASNVATAQSNGVD